MWDFWTCLPALNLLLDYVGLCWTWFPHVSLVSQVDALQLFRHFQALAPCSVLLNSWSSWASRRPGSMDETLRLWCLDVLRCFLKDFKGKKSLSCFWFLGFPASLSHSGNLWHSIDNFLPVSTCIHLYPLVSPCIPLYPLVSPCQVWCPNPTWGNHPKIFQRALLECETRHRKEGALEMQGMQGTFLTCQLHKCGYFTNKV